MIRERRISLENDQAPVELYFDDDGWPIPRPEVVGDESMLREFECPECHALTYGRFEPFVQRGVLAWCSTCNYTKVDKPTFKRYVMEHPETLEAEDNPRK